MLVVKIELHSAITGKITEIGRMVIANDGTSRDPRRGTYGGLVIRKTKNWMAHMYKTIRGKAKPVRIGAVSDYRRQDRPVWDLVALMLNNMGYGK